MSFPGPRFFSEADPSSPGTDTLHCELCPHSCSLSPGKSGMCRVRVNNRGRGEIPFYGFVTGLAMDPIEKKPLYHYRPGSSVFSAGFLGCNLRCPFCQNWYISQNTDSPGRRLTPAELISAASGAYGQATRQPAAGQSAAGLSKAPGQITIAYTYSEPLVHIEFLIDCMEEARKRQTANILVTNGCINKEAAAEVLSLADAANIDLKCFSKDSYSKVLGGDLDTVLNFIRTAHEKKVHVEITTLVVPGFNDSDEELDACAGFIAGIDPEIPWHLSAYHPDWKWEAPATSPALLAGTAARARKRLSFVYTGNIAGEKNDTPCPHCRKILVSRKSYHIDSSGLSLKEIDGKLQYFCSFCKKPAPFRY